MSQLSILIHGWRARVHARGPRQRVCNHLCSTTAPIVSVTSMGISTDVLNLRTHTQLCTDQDKFVHYHACCSALLMPRVQGAQPTGGFCLQLIVERCAGVFESPPYQTRLCEHHHTLLKFASVVLACQIFVQDHLLSEHMQ